MDLLTCVFPFLLSLGVLRQCLGNYEDIVYSMEEEEETPTVKPLDWKTSLRQTFQSRGVTNIQAIGRVFRRMDDDSNSVLNLEEFTKGLKDTGLELSPVQVDVLFKDFDTDNSDSISINELLRALRPLMNEFRENIVKKVFREFDKTEDGVVTIDDLKEVYSVYAPHSNGEEQRIFKKFLSNFEKDKNGQVTEEEFLSYFSEVSASVDSDTYFESMIRQAYNFSNNF